MCYNNPIWEVEYTDEFGTWWGQIDSSEQESLATSVELLRRLGPKFRDRTRIRSRGSRHSNMKELRSTEGAP